MSYVETPVETFRKFAGTPGWKNATRETIAGDFFSIGNESNLLWNPGFYEERDGHLFDPIRKMNVAGTANGDAVEESVITQLETWFQQKDSGLGVWISPRGSGVRPYPEEQITVYRIAYRWPEGTKILLFSSHQFKKEFINPEELRRFIFTEDDSEKSLIEIINWLKYNSLKKVETELKDPSERKKQAEYYANLFISGMPVEQIIHDMTRTGFLGENPIGCGPPSTTTSALPYSESYTPLLGYTEVKGWHPGTCRICGAPTIVGPCDICKPCELCL